MIIDSAISLGLFVITCALHLTLTRLIGRLHFVLAGYALAALTVLSALPTLIAQSPAQICYIVFLYILLWNLYLIFLINLMNSVSLHYMISIYEAPDGKLSEAGLLECYSDDLMLSRRLQCMAANGLVKAEDERVTLTPRGCRLAGFILFLRRVLALKSFG